MITYKSLKKEHNALLALKYAVKKLPASPLNDYIKTSVLELHSFLIGQHRKQFALNEYVENNFARIGSPEHDAYESYKKEIDEWDVFNPTEESKKIVWKLFDFMHIAPEENCCTALFYPKLCKPAQQMKDEQQATKNYIDSLCTDKELQTVDLADIERLMNLFKKAMQLEQAQIAKETEPLKEPNAVI